MNNRNWSNDFWQISFAFPLMLDRAHSVLDKLVAVIRSCDFFYTNPLSSCFVLRLLWRTCPGNGLPWFGFQGVPGWDSPLSEYNRRLGQHRPSAGSSGLPPQQLRQSERGSFRPQSPGMGFSVWISSCPPDPPTPPPAPTGSTFSTFTSQCHEQPTNSFVFYVHFIHFSLFFVVIIHVSCRDSCPSQAQQKRHPTLRSRPDPGPRHHCHTYHCPTPRLGPFISIQALSSSALLPLGISLPLQRLSHHLPRHHHQRPNSYFQCGQTLQTLGYGDRSFLTKVKTSAQSA